MKREIKFRVWDKENNDWYKPIFEGYKGNIYEPMLSMSGDLCMRTIDQLRHQSLFPDRFEVMQYTGLKDKNGVEIYDGDIIQWDFMNGRQISNEQVMHSLAWDGQISPQNAPFMSAWGSTCGKYYRTFMNIYDPTRFATVIGNIHQSPELLAIGGVLSN